MSLVIIFFTSHDMLLEIQVVELTRVLKWFKVLGVVVLHRVIILMMLFQMRIK